MRELRPVRSESCRFSQKPEECRGGSCDRLIELLSLFRNSDKCIDKENALREEIKEVLGRKEKKNEPDARNSIMDGQISMAVASGSQEEMSKEGNVRVLISEQFIDLKGKIQFSQEKKQESKKVEALEDRIRKLEEDLAQEKDKTCALLEDVDESERRFSEVSSQLQVERDTTERCQIIARALNNKLFKIRSLLEQAANKQGTPWQKKLNEVKLHLDMDDFALEQDLETLSNPPWVSEKVTKRKKISSSFSSAETI